MVVAVRGPGRIHNNVPEGWVIVQGLATDLRRERKLIERKK
jgi:hypothetical protein